MKLQIILFVLISITITNLLTTRAEKVKSQKDVGIVAVGLKHNKGDLETASTFGIGHGLGYRRRHYYGYGGHHGWSPWYGGGGGGFGYGHGHYDHLRPTFGKIIITYPKYIGHGHGHYGHGGFGGGHYGGGHYGGFKKGGFYPSRYLGPIGYGHGHGHGLGLGYGQGHGIGHGSHYFKGGYGW